MSASGEHPDRPGFFVRAWSGAKLLLGLAVALGVAVAVVLGLVRFATTNARFAIRELIVVGAKKKTEAELMRLGGIARGKNIFSLDTRAAEHGILEDPWLREVSVRRRLPDTITIEVVERDASALAAIGEQLYLVTREGEPFKRLEPGDPYDLPLVTGVSVEGLAADRSREIERIAVGVEVLRTWERMPLGRVHLAQEVRLAGSGAVVLTVGTAGVALHLGAGPWKKKLAMASEVIGRLASKGRTPGIVFLDNQAHPERVVVRML
jgi:cell division protein FtsQ